MDIILHPVATTGSYNSLCDLPDLSIYATVVGLNDEVTRATAAEAAITSSLPAASTTTPLMDGTAAIGTGVAYALANHIHPTDTSRAPLASPTFTGTTTTAALTATGAVSGAGFTALLASPGPIGGTTPATGTFSNLYATSGASFGSSSAGSASVIFNSAVGGWRLTTTQTAGSNRWTWGVDSTAEGGADTGSNFFMSRCNDAGSSINNVITIVRATGLVTFANTVTINSTLTANSTVSGAGFTARFASPGPIGNTTPSTGAFTTLAASGTVSGAGFTSLLASPSPIGNTTPSTGAFTTLSASGAVSGAGFTGLLASPGPVGSTAPSTGAFTTLAASGVVSGTGFVNFVTGYASSTSPAMSGTATVGVSTAYARADHIHPTDTSRSPLASPTFTGVPAAPTAALATNTTQIATTAFVQAAFTDYTTTNAAGPILG